MAAENLPVADHYASTEAKIATTSFVWSLKMFSSTCLDIAQGKQIFSPIFSLKDFPTQKYCLKIYPRGYYDNAKVALFLRLTNSNKFQTLTQFRCSILNKNGEEAYKGAWSEKKFMPEKSVAGCDFIDIAYLLEHKDDLLHNDVLTIYCEVMCYMGYLSTLSKRKPNPLNNENADPQVCTDLKWLYESGFLSNVALRMRHQKFAGHKSILAARSPFFKRIFENNAKTHVIDVTDNDDKVMLEILRFIYTSKAQNLQPLARDLATAATKYELEDLKLICEKSIDNIDDQSQGPSKPLQKSNTASKRDYNFSSDEFEESLDSDPADYLYAKKYKRSH